jgi:predicted RNase H-like HicB family nuclease
MSNEGNPGRFYPIRLIQQRSSEGEKWTAEHPTLLGCHVVRPDPQSAIDDLAVAREEWLERARMQGRRIPNGGEDMRYELELALDATSEEAAAASKAISSAADEIPSVQLPEVRTWRQ